MRADIKLWEVYYCQHEAWECDTTDLRSETANNMSWECDHCQQHGPRM